MTLLRDLRYGFRVLRRHRAFAVAAVAVVALGIGATTAVFSVVRGVLLTPLPYRDPDRLILFRAELPGYHHQALLNPEELFALRERSDLFESFAVINVSEGNFTDQEVMAAATAASVSDNFFDTLGVPLLLGRSVSTRDVGTNYVNGVDISYEAWQRHFHGDPKIVGRRIDVNNLPMTVVGVLPPRFELNLGAAVAIPLRVDIWYPRFAGYDRDPARSRVAVARLKPGVSRDAAETAVEAIAPRLVVDNPSRYRGGAVQLSVGTLADEVVTDVKPALTALMAAVAFVLLVACANLALLLLSRGSARSRELAVRMSIGATRGQIVRQLLTEAAIVAAFGTGAGLVLARWGVGSLLLLAPASLPRRDAIAIDVVVAIFAVLASLLAALLASLIPAWHAARADVTGSLREDTASARPNATTRGILVACQLALSLVLLVSAGLMGRAFVKLRTQPLGFEPDRAVSMSIALSLRRFGQLSIDAERAARLDFYHRLAGSLRQLPGVAAVGFTFPVPFSGTLMNQVYSTGSGAPEHQAEGIIALGGYFEMMRIPLVAGRYFTTADDNRPVAVVDERLARELWPQQPAVGQRLLLSRLPNPIWTEVVGVVAHIRTQPARAADLPQIWITYATRAYGLSLVARSDRAVVPVQAIERGVRQLQPGRPVHDVRLLTDAMAESSSDTRFALFVLGTFAVLALMLTAVGVYGSVAYATARRTREIAVRRALGARPSRIVSLVVRDSASWSGAGLAAGFAGSLALSRYLDSLLVGVGARDPLTFTLVGILLVAIALIASIIPALRAVRVDPMLALRSE